MPTSAFDDTDAIIEPCYPTPQWPEDLGTPGMCTATAYGVRQPTMVRVDAIMFSLLGINFYEQLLLSARN